MKTLPKRTARLVDDLIRHELRQRPASVSERYALGFADGLMESTLAVLMSAGLTFEAAQAYRWQRRRELAPAPLPTRAIVPLVPLSACAL